ncbi:uncharacterized protein BDR25DRAFT_355364 [Lindgomyces ingoldianus]|uniref:Uncharacterized protein n=1 Tax=Lindgomyces ingoldianus TaxID=673940 RepID=A0ACB6QVP0_9PLEO|nr:uncharacterized protein BDR25DRAFT_355364 [Lindgomyces ingoldianus]KAF2470256.1 hypothetical protein BDR25DRAFT_355364 [Lindgomyces ingoldianus]
MPPRAVSVGQADESERTKHFNTLDLVDENPKDIMLKEENRGEQEVDVSNQNTQSANTPSAPFASISSENTPSITNIEFPGDTTSVDEVKSSPLTPIHEQDAFEDPVPKDSESKEKDAFTSSADVSSGVPKDGKASTVGKMTTPDHAPRREHTGPRDENVTWVQSCDCTQQENRRTNI